MPDETGASQTEVSGRYAIERELGRGGSATVYLARDLQDGTSVALKLLHQEFSGSRAAERFAQEIRLLREFDHPGILTVTDAGEWQGRPFYVMPYVDGESLQDRLRRERRLPFDEVTRIGQRLCEALAYAHAQKVVHRDVKPANVMLSGDEVYLTDFGIAKALEPVGESPHSTTGVARGTRAYMSPEQATADRDLDHRSDIFSLGCVLYEMIAGQNPYQSADESRMLMRRITDAPDPLSRHRDGVPAGLERAVMKALEREPADRWQGVGEMGEGLGRKEETPSRATRRTLHARSRALLGVAAGTAAAVLLWKAWLGARNDACRLGNFWDTTSPRIVLATAFGARVESDAPSSPKGAAVREAVARWRDATIVEVSDVASWSEGPVALCMAARHNGDLLVTTRAVPSVGTDSIQLSLRVVGDSFDAQVGHTVSPASASDPGLWTMLLRRALQAMPTTAGFPESDSTAVPFLAWRECRAGWRELRVGNLDSAVARFGQSTAADAQYACPQFGLAIGLQLQEFEAPAEWRSAAARALALPHRWSDAERVALTATVGRADSRFAEACPALAKLAAQRASDYVLLTLRSDCLASDSTVVRRADGSLAFQSSWMEARRVLLEAEEQAPVGYHRVIMPRLSRVAPAAPTVRWGWITSKPGATFGAYPAREMDTSAFHPIAREAIERSLSATVPSSLSDALRDGKRLQADVAARWVERAPGSAVAHFAHATALELLGRLEEEAGVGAGALLELERAASAPEDPVPVLQLFEARVRMLLKSGQLQQIPLLVDSALARSTKPDDDEARVLGSLAVLTGRVASAIRLRTIVVARDAGVPLSDAAREELAALEVLASLGCCGHEIDTLEQSLRRRLRVELDETSRQKWEDRLLGRWISLAAPCRGWSSVTMIGNSTDAIVGVQRAIARGDAAAARAELDRLRGERARFNAGDIAVDYVYQEARASLAIGDTAEARERIDAWFAALPISGGLALGEMTQAAAIPRMLSIAVTLKSRLPETWRHLGAPSAALAALVAHAAAKDAAKLVRDEDGDGMCTLNLERPEVGT